MQYSSKDALLLNSQCVAHFGRKGACENIYATH
uniref:Uncharacterized protein n=1 Tax=Arundo donax TaxID=35708 RepID=A0A0A8XXA8_ARUDO